MNNQKPFADMTDPEWRDAQEIVELYLRAGRRHGNDPSNPLEYVALRSQRFAVMGDGQVYRFAATGAPKAFKPSGQAEGTPRRQPAIEVWTGQWRKLQETNGDGKPLYAKCLIWVPIAGTTNSHPGVTHLQWYKGRKGFKHPMDPPHRPTDEEIDAMNGRQSEMDSAVLAIMEREDIRPPDEAPAPKPRKAPRRTNREPDAA